MPYPDHFDWVGRGTGAADAVRLLSRHTIWVGDREYTPEQFIELFPAGRYSLDNQMKEANEVHSQLTEISPLQDQIGGDYYKELAIQPYEYSYKNNLNPLQHTVIKYITRYNKKGGKKDLEKAIHTIKVLMHLEYGE